MQEKLELVEVRPLKPFVGTYKCALSEADIVDDLLVEKEGGVIVKEKMPRKRFAGFISVERAARPDEAAAIAANALPPNLEVIAGSQGRMVIEHPKNRTVKVPLDVATSLVERGLAEIINSKRRK